MMNKDTQFLIVGLGLLGGSYALGLKQAGYKVNGIARRQESIDYAMSHQMIDAGSINDDLISSADIIICALYPKIMIDWINIHKDQFKKDAIISDVSGVKGNVVDVIQNNLNNEFIACHPMAGKENSGIEYANTEMFKTANYIVVPTKKNTKHAIEIAKEIGQILEFNHISELSVLEHDQMIAFLSQLTHVIAVSLMNTHDNQHLVEYTGDSFRDLTRIAKINEVMWSELFELNKDNLLNEINMFIDSINHFKEALVNDDLDEMKKLFITSTNRRKLFDK